MLKLIGIILVLIHTFLWLWSFGGALEWLSINVPWKPYSNPEFPHWLLFFHWGTVLFTATVFLYGYFTRWSSTPHFMAIGYGMMAIVCVVETFWFMTSKTKFLAMGLEYTAYIVILFILYNPAFRTQHFENMAIQGN